MFNPFASRRPVVTNVWQYAPYGFEPGQKYVLELNSSDIKDISEVKALQNYFKENNIICHIMFTKSGNAIKPVTAKTFTTKTKEVL